MIKIFAKWTTIKHGVANSYLIHSCQKCRQKSLTTYAFIQRLDSTSSEITLQKSLTTYAFIQRLDNTSDIAFVLSYVFHIPSYFFIFPPYFSILPPYFYIFPSYFSVFLHSSFIYVCLL